MTDLAPFIAYLSIALLIIFNALGAGIGGGIASQAFIAALNIQPRSRNELNRVALVGIALLEAATVFSLIILTFFNHPKNITLPQAIAQLGVTAALGISGIAVGFASALPIQEAMFSIARQPFFSQKIMNLMLLAQSIIQTASLFGFIISLVIALKITAVTTLGQSFLLLAPGIAIGFGSLGPIIGLGNLAGTICRQIGTNRKAYGVLVPFLFMSGAIVETPLIFAFLVALIILILQRPGHESLQAVKAIAAAVCISIGAFMPSLSSGKTAAATGEQIGKQPENYQTLAQASVLGQGLIDAAAVYALIIAILIYLLR